MENKIPKRNEIPEEFTWDLSDIFANDALWLDAKDSMQRIAKKLASYEGKLGGSADALLSFFKVSDDASSIASQLYGYASCKSDQDTGNALYQSYRGKAIRALTQLRSAGAYSVPEIAAIPDETLEKFFTECPELETYRRPIYLIRRRKGHVLSEKEETLLAAAGEMAEAPDTICSTLRNADLKFPDVTDSAGRVHPLTDGSFVPLLESPDRDFRRTVFQTYYGTIRSFKNTIASTLDAQFKQLAFFAKARNYTSTLEASLDEHEIPTVVYYNLIEAVHANLKKMHRYVELRQKLLQTDSIHMYDVYTPIVPEATARVPYEKAKQTVLEALSCLGEDYTALLRMGFDNRWIDVYENEGKRSGAYSSGNAIPHPFVLLNYKDNLDSMFTLAHEMGHALHSFYSNKNQPIATSDYVIFVAEVASTCNEVLLMRYLLKKTTDKKQKAYLINHFLDQFKGTVFRQTMFAEFELSLGQMAENGETFTADSLSRIYYDLNHTYFGTKMTLDEGIELEWARIPHFFYNYYVFQYATGFSAAVAIANRILKEGAPAVEDYKKFLSGGSSTDPISLLKIAGVDMSTPAPINDALKLFDKLLKELAALMEE